MRGDRQETSHGHRSDRIAEAIREEVSQIVGYELRDERIGFATVTDVRLTPDMSIARVYVSILGTPEEQHAAIVTLNKAAGFVRRLLAPRLSIRRVPSVVFSLDDLLERGNRIENLLKEDEQ